MSARRARALRDVLHASQRAGSAAPRSARAFFLQLRRLVAVAAVAPAVFVTEHLKAEHAALPVRWTAAGRTARYLGRLPCAGKVADDARGLFDHGEELHPPLATGTRRAEPPTLATERYQPALPAPLAPELRKAPGLRTICRQSEVQG